MTKDVRDMTEKEWEAHQREMEYTLKFVAAHDAGHGQTDLIVKEGDKKKAVSVEASETPGQN